MTVLLCEARTKKLRRCLLDHKQGSELSPCTQTIQSTRRLLLRLVQAPVLRLLWHCNATSYMQLCAPRSTSLGRITDIDSPLLTDKMRAACSFLSQNSNSQVSTATVGCATWVEERLRTRATFSFTCCRFPEISLFSVLWEQTTLFLFLSLSFSLSWRHRRHFTE